MLVGLLAVGAAWGIGVGIEALTGALPAPVAGLLVLAGALLASPRLLEAVGPGADALARVLPLLFVPAVVAVAAVDGRVDVAAAAVAVAVSVPAGWAVTATLARGRAER
jgi:putative effector of murein hydrolase LrgA (UPF0299 family)